MIRPFLVMLLKVYLWAQEETPTGYFHATHGRWCIGTNWEEFGSKGHVHIYATCKEGLSVKGELQLQKEGSNLYNVTAQGEATYEDFIDRAVYSCSIPLNRVGMPKDLFTFEYDSDWKMLVTHIQHLPVAMVSGECV